MLIFNAQYYPEKLKPAEIEEFFDEMDYKYKKQFEKFYKE